MKAFAHRCIDLKKRKTHATRWEWRLTLALELVMTWPEIIGYERRGQHRSASEYLSLERQLPSLANFTLYRAGSRSSELFLAVRLSNDVRTLQLMTELWHVCRSVGSAGKDRVGNGGQE
jgi:hypothetical protein